MIVSVLLLVPLFTFTSAQYKTLLHDGHNYTYARDEVSTHAGAVEWCNQLGGNLPSIHTQRDISFLSTQLVGHHRSLGAIALGARKVATPYGNYTWQWDDGTPVDYLPEGYDVSDCEPKCCGLLLWPNALGLTHNVIWSTDICEGFLRRKVCKLRPGTAVIDGSRPDILALTTTESPTANLSDSEIMTSLIFQHNKLRQAVSLLSEKLDLLGESLPQVVEQAIRSGAQDKSDADPVASDTALMRLRSLNQRLGFLFLTVFLICLGYVMVKTVPSGLGIKRRRQGDGTEPITHRRLV